MASTRWAQSTFVPASGPHRMRLAGDAARFDVASNHAPIDRLAVLAGDSAWKLQAQPGDVIQVHVGEAHWSPTCALSKSNLKAPVGFSWAPIDFSAAEIGPEGFTITWSNGSYHVSGIDTSQEHNHSHATTKAHRSCDTYSVSGKMEISSPIGGVGGGGSADASYCEGTEDQEAVVSRRSEIGRTTADQSASVSFHQGLFLWNTPFPSMPSGSLLLVEVEPGQNAQDAIQHIQVVSRNTSLVMPRDADVYLVVNDLKDPSCTARGGQLQLTVEHLRPQSSTMPRFAHAMGAAVKALHENASPLIKQGSVSAQELAALREHVRQKVRLECDGTFDFNDPLGGFFTAWLENELTVVEQRADVFRLDRELRLQRLRLHNLIDGLKAAKDETRLLHLLPVWSLANLDATLMRQGAKDVLDYLNRFVYPVVALRYPEVFSVLAKDADFTTLVAQLSAPQITQEIAGTGDTALARLSVRVTDRILTALANAQPLAPISLQLESLRTLALTFPRETREEYASWRRADSKRASTAWTALDAGKPAVLTVYPEDLYGRTMQEAVQMCSVAVLDVN